jgi:hypothetical protein
VAIGNPREDVGGVAKTGAVTVLYGQSTPPYLGLVPNGTNFITQNSGTVPGSNETNDYFGAALVSGDFNGDGYADLAVGAPGQKVSKVGAAGMVWVFSGGSSGLRVDNAKTFHGNAEKNDHFGSALGAGDVTGDGRDDLAVIVEGENIAGHTGAEGCVDLLKGSASGVTSTGANSVCVQNLNVGGHLNSVAVGRFHGGGNADLAVYASQLKGAPAGSGALVLFRGSGAGISAGNVAYLSQNTAAVSDTAEAGDQFGAALAVGDTDGDGADDLAVGVPGENSGAGAVHVFLGGAAGLTSALDLFFSEDHPLVGAGAQATEGFGGAVRFLDVSNDGRPELLVGAPFEDFSYNTGVLFVLGLATTSGSVTLSGCGTLTRGGLGGISAYGVGSPIAGGVTAPTELPNVS